MKLLRQGNRWSCLVTAFAMVLDVAVEELIAHLGHDGSEILWPELPEPLRRRGFHVEELAYVCRRYSVVLANYVPCFGYSPNHAPGERFYDFQNECNDILKVNNGVLTGCYQRSTNAHAVAWNAAERRIYDPSGYYSNLESFGYDTVYIPVGIRNPTLKMG